MNKEGKPKKYEYWLIVTYIGLAALCVYLNAFSGRRVDWSNVAISSAQFLITLCIFIYAYRNSFRRTNQLISDFSRISGQLRRGDIKSKDEILFKNDLLQKKFEDYQKEIERLNQISDQSLYCDIEDYINDSAIDEGINRGFLNLVPGVMTGLGILGTFIGLSFGLQNFNTGTAEEISNSIAPLMDGIKVAFHTSIYGMVFSLVFNAVYKKKIEAAEGALNEFLSVYYRTIGTKTDTEAMTRMLSYQQSQASNVEQLSEKLSDAMAEKFARILEPKFSGVNDAIERVRAQSEASEKEESERLSSMLSSQFDRMNDTIDKFTEVASRSQVEGVETMVSKFIEQMNSAMGENFVHLGNAIEATCAMQKQQSEQMQAIIDRADGTIQNLDSLNDKTVGSVEKMQNYVDSMEEIQKLSEQRAVLMNQQLTASHQILDSYQGYLEVLKESYAQIARSSEAFERNTADQAGRLHQMAASVAVISASVLEKSKEGIEQIAEQSTRTVDTALEAMKNFEHLGDMAKAICEMQKQQGEQIRAILEHADGTIQNFDNLDKKTVDAVDKMQNYVDSIDKLQKRGEERAALVNQQLTESNNILESYRDYLDKLGDSNTQIAESARDFERIAVDHVEKIKQMADSVAKIPSEVLEKAKEGIEQIGNQSAGQLNTVINQMNGSSELIKNQVNDAMKAFVQMSNSLQNVIAESSKSVNSAARDNNVQMQKQLDEYCRQFTETAKKQVGQLNDVNKSVNSELQRTTDQLKEAVGSLNSDLQTVLNKTFDNFDANLSVITEHMAGTYSNMQATTDRINSTMVRLPKVLDAAMSNIDATVNEMQKGSERNQKQINDYMHAVQVLEKQISEFMQVIQKEREQSPAAKS